MKVFLITLLLVLATGLTGTWTPPAQAAARNAEDLFVVDCLLPGKIRRLGSRLTYLTARRATKTSAKDCEIRGGEYTSYDRANYSTALSVWLALAQQGDPVAQNNVGEIYEKGLGIEPEYRLAAQWYDKSAQQGYARAQVNLGHLYEEGKGVPKDKVKALDLFRKAAGLDSVDVAYVPAEGEVAKLRQERDQLQMEREQLSRTVEQTRQQMRQAQQKLQRQRKASAKADRELQRLREQLEKARKNPSKGASGDTLKKLRRQLQARTREAEKRRAQLQKLNRQVAGFEGKTQRLETRLQKAERERLTETQGKSQKLAKTRSELERMRKQYKTTSRDLRKRAEALQGKEREAQLAQAQVAELKAQLAQAQQALAIQQSQPERPVIRMIDPPVEVTRSTGTPRIKTLSADQRTIIGRVEAAAGVMAVLVNDKQQKLGKSGMFRADVALAGDDTPVRVTAVDRKGQRESLEFMLARNVTKPSAKEPTIAKNDAKGVDFGDFYALVIGNNDYRHLPKLRTAGNDARAVAKILEKRFGFEVTLLLNADRYQTLSALNKLREDLTEDDNLLIYYAGHGELDRINNRGHWLPIDAERNSSANWISNVAITDVLNAMSARHVLVVADSCYSGALTRAAVASLDGGMSERARRKWLEAMSSKRARVVLTSGGLAPVLDSGGGDHSVFARAFLDTLGSAKGIIEAQRLYQDVAAEVASSPAASEVEQLPQYAPLKFAGHETGDFFFVSRR